MTVATHRSINIKKSARVSLYPILFSLLFASACLTLTIGDIEWNKVFDHAVQRMYGETTGWNPLLDERIPRLIILLSCGASLSVAGAVMQSLFQNPLASPNILGISCGGSLIVTLVFVMGWHLTYPFAIPIGAFLGSLLTLTLVYLLSRSLGGGQLNTLILTGVAISSLLFAIQGAIIYAFRDHWVLIQTLAEWEAGSTMDRNWRHVHMQLPLTIVGLYGSWRYRSEMDILALGDEEARNLGIEAGCVRWRLFILVALLTGGAIASVGAIAFFGLVLPHIVRTIKGPANYRLIPLCILVGGISFAAIDILMRLLKIHFLSIGNISAILGGLFFLILLQKTRRFSNLIEH